MTGMTSNAIPNLAGVASKDLVEKIGSGSFSASYINWSRTMNLLRKHAPNWLVDYVPARDGSLLHQAPIGAYLLIRFQNMETGFSTPALPQAVMDNRNKSIPFDKITSRDITDTQRRGLCMAAAMHFGLAYELWAKMPLESGYTEQSPEAQRPPVPLTGRKETNSSQEGTVGAARASEGASEATFREAALAKNIHTVAIDALVELVKSKLGGDFSKGHAQLDKNEAEYFNNKYAPSEEATNGDKF